MVYGSAFSSFLDRLETVPLMTVFRTEGGMLGVTGFGLLFTPAFYTFVRKIGRKEHAGGGFFAYQSLFRLPR